MALQVRKLRRRVVAARAFPGPWLRAAGNTYAVRRCFVTGDLVGPSERHAAQVAPRVLVLCTLGFGWVCGAHVPQHGAALGVQFAAVTALVSNSLVHCGYVCFQIARLRVTLATLVALVVLPPLMHVLDVHFEVMLGRQSFAAQVTANRCTPASNISFHDRASIHHSVALKHGKAELVFPALWLWSSTRSSTLCVSMIE